MTNNIYSDEYKQVTEKLRQARLGSGFTQEQVAEKLGKPQSYVSKSEAGERRLDITELKKFAALYLDDIIVDFNGRKMRIPIKESDLSSVPSSLEEDQQKIKLMKIKDWRIKKSNLKIRGRSPFTPMICDKEII